MHYSGGLPSLCDGRGRGKQITYFQAEGSILFRWNLSLGTQMNPRAREVGVIRLSPGSAEFSIGPKLAWIISSFHCRKEQEQAFI